MILNILGTSYEIIVKKFDEDEVFGRRSINGYCDGYVKKIAVCDMHTYKGWEHESEETIDAVQKETLRHEIVHAYFNESGLKDSSLCFEAGWATNEEMVDWIALQGTKIYHSWMEAGAI